MSKHKSILSSLTALGASELPVATNSVPRNSVIASVAAAGVSLLACQSADAGTISVFNPNVNVGFAAGDLNVFKLDIASLQGSGFNLDERTFGHRLVELGPNPVSVSVRMTAAAGVAAPGAYGKKFSQIGTYATVLTVLLEGRFTGGGAQGSNFSQEYYAFSFQDTSSQTHYGWIYGTLTGDYSDLTYNLISYAYDTTPGIMIKTGQTQDTSSTPEPSTAALGAMAALILGAAGVRKWNKARA